MNGETNGRTKHVQQIVRDVVCSKEQQQFLAKGETSPRLLAKETKARVVPFSWQPGTRPTPLPEVAAAEQASARAADAARVAAEYMHLDFNHQSGYQKYLQQRRKAQDGPASVDPATYRAGINAHRRQQFSAAAIPAVEQTSFQPYIPTLSCQVPANSMVQAALGIQQH